MKVLQLNTFVDPVGGAEVYALDLAQELERRGHDVVRFGVSTEGERDEPGWRAVHRPAFPRERTFRDAGLTAALAESLRRQRPDVIHAHNLHSLPIELLELLAGCGIPVVQTVHDYSSVCPNTWCVLPDGTACAGGAGRKCFENDCGRNYPFDSLSVVATMLRLELVRSFSVVSLCPSRWLADTLSAHGFRDVRLLPYFVDERKLAADPEPREPHSLLYLGRLEPEKGVDVLLRAMPRVLAAVPSTTLAVVGGGSLAGALREQARGLGIAGAVRFHPKVAHEEVKRFYARATAKVLPSIWTENSPLAAYECLITGLPLLGSRIGGIPDLVEDGRTGFLFRPRDPEDLADKALRLLALGADERAALSARAREVGARYTRAANVDAVEAVYREAAATGTPGRAPAAVAVDLDLLESMHQVGGEVGRLQGLFEEHATYIQGLEGRFRELEQEYHRTCSSPVRLHLERLEQEYGGLRGEYERLLAEYRRQSAYVDRLEVHLQRQTGYVDEAERAHRAQVARLPGAPPPARLRGGRRLRGRTVAIVRGVARSLRLPKIFH